MLSRKAKKGKITIRIFGACDPISIALNPKRAVIKAEKKCALLHIEVWYSFAKALCSESNARKSSFFIFPSLPANVFQPLPPQVTYPAFNNTEPEFI